MESKDIRRQTNRSGGGFSLIELIIAIAILVILTGLLAPNILRYVEKSRQTKDLQALDTLREEVTLAIIDGDINEHANANACYFFGGGYDNAYVTST